MADWPVALRGIVESVVTTCGPNGRWNVAALGLRAGEPVTARTWGATRTARNFDRTGEGYVQFTRDPVTFVEAALSVREHDDPVLEDADAWVRVRVERIEDGESGGTRWSDWRLDPVESGVERLVVPAIDRGLNAVVEATVAASRLDVDAYDESALRSRIAYFGDVARRCGGEREIEAVDLLDELLGR